MILSTNAAELRRISEDNAPVERVLQEHFVQSVCTAVSQEALYVAKHGGREIAIVLDDWRTWRRTPYPWHEEAMAILKRVLGEGGLTAVFETAGSRSTRLVVSW